MPEINYKIPLAPVGDRVIVKPDPAEEVTKAGIIIPDNAKEKAQTGVILACGEGRGIDNEILQLLNQIKKGIRRSLTVNELTEKDLAWLEENLPLNGKTVIKYEPGMKIMYGRYSGSEIEYKGVKYLIMRTSDIAAIIEDES